MDNDIVIAIISGACSIIAAILTLVVKNYYETRGFYPIHRDRRKALEGKWAGKVDQYQGNTLQKSYNFDFDLEIKGRKIRGTGIINADKLYYVALNGSFQHDSFLKLDYRNPNHNVIQFGSLILYLSPCSSKLTGEFVGYGHIAQAIVHGTCELNKQ